MTDNRMDDFRANARALLEKLRAERDELNVQMHLAKADARDEWNKLERKYEQLQGKVHEVTESAGESSREIGAALGLLGDELRDGYKRIRDAIKA